MSWLLLVWNTVVLYLMRLSIRILRERQVTELALERSDVKMNSVDVAAEIPDVSGNRFLAILTSVFFGISTTNSSGFQYIWNWLDRDESVRLSCVNRWNFFLFSWQMKLQWRFVKFTCLLISEFVTNISQKRTNKERTKIGFYFDLIHFSVFLLEILHKASQIKEGTDIGIFLISPFLR